ncbi:hypothetical protein GLUCOINTEAF2_0202897 [Komagataeibacter intermedius AF2]|uniref:Uncharacterized protein n=1 Tax=Komagataeibacter intermedius AF2 TaxID=1458464 RepID=A0A0N1FAJ3_9PROT|nr:hypothetical protein GLUCOINTEAF2_0202897 [Komagataeibacter intermedius AF2]
MVSTVWPEESVVTPVMAASLPLSAASAASVSVKVLPPPCTVRADVVPSANCLALPKPDDVISPFGLASSRCSDERSSCTLSGTLRVSVTFWFCPSGIETSPCRVTWSPGTVLAAVTDVVGEMPLVVPLLSPTMSSMDVKLPTAGASLTVRLNASGTS